MQKQDEILMLLSTVTADFDDPDDEIFNYSCSNLALTTRADIVYVLDKEPQSYSLRIRRTYPGQVIEAIPAFMTSVSFGGQLNNEEGYSDDVIIDLRDITFIDDTGLGVSLSDICTEVAVGQCMNEAIVGVTDMFLSHTKISATDAISFITTVPSLDGSDERELTQAILAVSNQGSLSNYAWSGALKSFLSSGQEAVDEGSIVLQTDSPFKIQSFLNTVLQVIEVAFSAILMVLAAVLTGLLAIIAGVVSIILATFKSFNPDIDIDPEANNEYVRGVIGANASFTRNQFSANDDIFKTDSAIRSVIGPFELFTWAQDTSLNSVINMNMFMNLSFNAVELMETLRQEVGYRTYSQYNEIITELELPYLFQLYSDPAMDDTFAHNTDYLMRLHFDKDELLLQYKRCTMMSALPLLELGGTYTINVNDTDYFTIGYDDPVKIMIARLLRCLAICKRDSISLAAIPNPNFNLPSVTECRNYLNAIRESFDDTRDLSDVPTSFSIRAQSADGWGGKYVTSLMNGVSECYRPLIDFTAYGCGLRVGGEEWDQLIPTPSVALPNFSTAEVVAAISLVIGAVGAVFLASKSISRRLRARRQVKMARRTDALNAKRNAYLNDPQNKQLKAEYTSALVSYDKRASIFGWPSYDAVNGRMNVNVPGSNATSHLNGYLNTTDSTEYLASLIK